MAIAKIEPLPKFDMGSKIVPWEKCLEDYPILVPCLHRRPDDTPACTRVPCQTHECNDAIGPYKSRAVHVAATRSSRHHRSGG
jgi:hypothetical protein